VLYSPDRHEPLGDAAWDESRARAAITSLAARADRDFDEASGTWPMHPNDDEPGVAPQQRGVYGGTAGIIWALDQLIASGHAPAGRDYTATVEELDDAIQREPDEPDIPTVGFLPGRAGPLALAQRYRDDPDRAETLRTLVAGMAEHPAGEPFYGAPGMMLLAAAEVERTGDAGMAAAWGLCAAHLLATWQVHDDIGVRFWTQRFIVGREDRYVGFGHGFAGNVFALLHGPGLRAEQRREVERDAIATATRLAVVEEGLANWPALIDQPMETASGIRTQWCHGAAGMTAALAAVGRDDDAFGALLEAGGATTWAAGPLRDRAGLCHGTAGNAYAFLALHARTGDEVWLDRARRFAMHALAQVEREATPWHSLFTGETGVALCLRSCLEADARFPALAWF